VNSPPANVIELIKKKKDESRKVEIVENFMKNFKEEYARDPTTDEVYENLREQVAMDIVQRVFNKAKSSEKDSGNTKPSAVQSRTGALFRNALNAINSNRITGNTLERMPPSDENV
jgi:hypothetical protein